MPIKTPKYHLASKRMATGKRRSLVAQACNPRYTWDWDRKITGWLSNTEHSKSCWATSWDPVWNSKNKNKNKNKEGRGTAQWLVLVWQAWGPDSNSKETITSVDEDMEKQEPWHSADRNVRWGNCFGNQVVSPQNFKQGYDMAKQLLSYVCWQQQQFCTQFSGTTIFIIDPNRNNAHPNAYQLMNK